MTPLQLEQLISGYIDHELPAARKQEVEQLLRTDKAAKKLCDEFMLIRKGIKAIPKRDLPSNFQKNLFRQIEMEVVPYSGALVRQGSGTSEAAPLREPLKDFLEAKPVRERSNSANVMSNMLPGMLRRLKNPRVFAYPAVAVIIAAVFYFAGTLKTGDVAVRPPEQGQVVVPSENENTPNAAAQQTVPPPALPLSGTEPPTNGSPIIISSNTGLITVDIACRLTPEAKTSQYIPKLLADSGFEWVMRQNGHRQSTIYEFQTTPENLIPIITQLHSNRNDVLAFSLPSNFMQFFVRDADGLPKDQKEIGPETSVRVRFYVTQ